ncbi:hypothetical protein [Nodularia sp. NIES-3585]|uniref:hypothetical protein n=1 Tax=Nodularia sp. NIES-3585 TaxID=1973477 RepID=UPI000B5D00F0|nr:hypothetical protein [Nodularia sp. NIES-3585]GAX35195.1 hypothetical protein NIES3585_12020 [Nodularia sp. NIES-3585]
MKKNKAFDKVILGIQEDLTQLKKDVDSMPIFFSFETLSTLPENNFSLLQVKNSYDTKIKDLLNRVDKLRAKTQTSLDTYKMGSMNKETYLVNPVIDNSQDQEYYSQLIDLLARISILKENLHRCRLG